MYGNDLFVIKFTHNETRDRNELSISIEVEGPLQISKSHYNGAHLKQGRKTTKSNNKCGLQGKLLILVVFSGNVLYAECNSKF